MANMRRTHRGRVVVRNKPLELVVDPMWDDTHPFVLNPEFPERPSCLECGVYIEMHDDPKEEG